MRLHFLTTPPFELTYANGETVTRYPQDRWTGGAVVEGDHFHATILGITPVEHRLQHELAHHVVGIFAYRFSGSPILWNAAHGIDPPATSSEEEWLVTALQYHALDRSADYGALVDLQGKGVDVQTVSDVLRSLFLLARSGTIDALAVHFRT